MLKGLLGLGGVAGVASVTTGSTEAARRGYSGPQPPTPPNGCICPEGFTCLESTCFLQCETTGDCFDRSGIECTDVPNAGNLCLSTFGDGWCTSHSQCPHGYVCRYTACYYGMHLA